MDSVNKYILLLVLLSTFSSFPQDDVDRQFSYAKGLYNSQDFFHSVTELKRLLFFDSIGTYKYEANFFIGNAYKEGARLNDAILYFSEAVRTAPTKKEKIDAEIEIIKANILRRTFSQAHNMLDRMAQDTSEENKNEIIYWRGWTYIFEDKWVPASEEFMKIDTTHQLAEFCRSVDDEMYSVTLARAMSYLIPGSGQFYTGNYISGILSLGWNVLWGYLTINAFIEERIFDGFVIGTLLWLRFYNGSIQNAEKFAIEQNLEISNKALNYLQFQYTGRKP